MDSRTVGIVGGGQLGRMMVEAGHRLGIKTVILDALGNKSPAGEIAQLSVEGSCMLSSSNETKTREFAAQCDVITIEVEHVDTVVLSAIEKSGSVIHPNPATIAIIQDKFRQKDHLAAAGVPLADYMEVVDSETLIRVGELFGYPFMLKSKLGAYDGNGNFVVTSPETAIDGYTKLGGGTHGLYAERWVPYEKELAVMVVRSATEIKMYPVVETTQKNNICHTVMAPAQVSAAAIDKALKVAEKCVSSFEVSGIFGVEMFLLADGRVLLNEVAPRPHNSGHYTIEACMVDQFENHLRAVLGLPLGNSDMNSGAAIMVNILGEDTMEATKKPLVKVMQNGGGGIHWYGKQTSRAGRKMAHVTFVGPTMGHVIRQAECTEIAKFGGCPVVGIIMGSDSDMPTMKAAADVLVEFGIPFEFTIVSAHRTPERMFDYGKEAASRGIKVVIAGAGGAAHLPGMVAALTPLPVIGVPIKTAALSGVDSLYSIVQMPRGVPVATVAIGNAMNAGLLAVRMLSIGDAELLEKISEWNAKQESTVLEKAERVEGLLGEAAASGSADQATFDAKYAAFVGN